ncbi:unnamed protein product [Discula destructiva]
MLSLCSWSVASVAALVAVSGASPVTDSPQAGSTTADAFPPANTHVNSTLFPPESVVGFPLTTVTGAEPELAAETAAPYPYNSGPSGEFPLVAPPPHGESNFSTFDLMKYWGNLSPWYSVPSSDYGLPDTSPSIPAGCDIVQLHLLYRHGARYPTAGAAPATFASKIANATKNGGFSASGDLNFLADWTYRLGAELLTPFGRSQNFLLGVEHRQLYGKLLNNFTEQGTLPVFRTESQDRMVKTANNFAAGFFGVPEYLDEVSIEILVESPGFNNSGAPYETCTNADVASRGSLGSTAATAFAKNAFNHTLARLNSEVTGITFTPTDAVAMLQLCSYETVALGFSPFCGLFTRQDFLNYEYYYDLSFYYNNGPGSPVSAAQGKGYLQEFVARFTGTYPTADSALNETFDDDMTYFPLTQSLYADATHEVVVLDTLTAFNLSAVFAGEPLSLTENTHKNSFVASKTVPFATHFTAQVLECPAYQPTKQIRFIVNDAVIPVHDSYAGCDFDAHGLCSFDNVVSVLQKRIEEIDYDYDCFENYTAKAGVNYNGRAPR